jgi:Coenzyme PQQ synthesis protein D (PqqD)
MQSGAKMGMQRMVELTKRVVVPAHVLIRHLDGESVLLNLKSERYFGLDTTGTRMWELVTTEPSVGLAFEKLLAEFDVEPEPLRIHLNELLSGLVENGLLQVLPVDVGNTSAV